MELLDIRERLEAEYSKIDKGGIYALVYLGGLVRLGNQRTYQSEKTVRHRFHKRFMPWVDREESDRVLDKLIKSGEVEIKKLW